MIFLDFKTAKQEKIISHADTMKINVPEKENVLPINRKSHILPEVTVKEKKKWGREGEGLRNANIVIDVEKSVDHLIDKQEYEPATINGFLMLTNKYFTAASARSNKFSYKGREVIFVLNNNLITDSRLNSEYIPDEIELITICETEGLSVLYGGSKGDEVVVFLYTYKDYHIRKASYGMRMTKFEGYALVKEFFSPQYDIGLPPKEKDYRRTLYWNPDVKTDANGKASVSFYNNSSCKKMNVSVETVTENGVIGVLNK